MALTVTYEQFIMGAQPADVRAMTLFSQGVKPRTSDAAEADAWFAQCARLESFGILRKVSRTYERIDGVMFQTFEGFIDPEAQVWLARAAQERVQYRDTPLPTSG